MFVPTPVTINASWKRNRRGFGAALSKGKMHMFTRVALAVIFAASSLIAPITPSEGASGTRTQFAQSNVPPAAAECFSACAEQQRACAGRANGAELALSICDYYCVPCAEKFNYYDHVAVVTLLAVYDIRENNLYQHMTTSKQPTYTIR
jgi:hypothetical protein